MDPDAWQSLLQHYSAGAGSLAPHSQPQDGINSRGEPGAIVIPNSPEMNSPVASPSASTITAVAAASHVGPGTTPAITDPAGAPTVTRPSTQRKLPMQAVFDAINAMPKEELTPLPVRISSKIILLQELT
jgi:hypothetical protein